MYTCTLCVHVSAPVSTRMQIPSDVLVYSKSHLPCIICYCHVQTSASRYSNKFRYIIHFRKSVDMNDTCTCVCVCGEDVLAVK